MTLPIFVYGTLKSGEEREGKWPFPPERIEQAVARGTLYDLGPYPAMTDGEDAILGELWHIAAEHMPQTLAVLDRIEGFGVGAVDLYVRQIIVVNRMLGSDCPAYAYLIADKSTLLGHPRIALNDEGYCVWTGKKSSSHD